MKSNKKNSESIDNEVEGIGGELQKAIETALNLERKERARKAAELGSFLKHLRQESDLTLREAASKTGLSSTFISFMEKGYRSDTNTIMKATEPIIEKLAKAYDYPLIPLLQKAELLPNLGESTNLQIYEYEEPTEIISLIMKHDNLTHKGKRLEFSDIARIVDMIKIMFKDYDKK